MNIVIIGGSGLIGKQLSTLLRERGHAVTAASPSTGVNTVTGEGLSEALAGAQVVVEGARYDPNMVLGGEPLLLNGVGVRKRLVFDIYVGGLYVPKRAARTEELVSQPGPKRVALRFLRDVEGELFVNSLHVGLKANHTEAELARVFFQQQGVDMGRVVLEGGSRTTRENAIQVAALLGERCKQPWLLVTSAWHMPRSVPEFEAVGCQVTPYPVDFRTGAATAWTEYSLARSLLLWQTALHEWLGLWVYGVTR